MRTIMRMGRQRAGVPGLTAEQARRVVHAMNELLGAYETGVALAKALDVDPGTVSRTLLGRTRPSIQTAEAVARLLGKSTWELLGDPSGPASFSEAEVLAARPRLVDALDTLREKAAPGRAAVLAAAASLPDLQETTWMAMLMDPAHRDGGEGSEGAGVPSSGRPPHESGIRKAVGA